MSIYWLQPAMGLLFVTVWLMIAQIVVGERHAEHRNTIEPPQPVLDG